jgi:hypothetical protein
MEPLSMRSICRFKHCKTNEIVCGCHSGSELAAKQRAQIGSFVTELDLKIKESVCVPIIRVLLVGENIQIAQAVIDALRYHVYASANCLLHFDTQPSEDHGNKVHDLQLKLSEFDETDISALRARVTQAIDPMLRGRSSGKRAQERDISRAFELLAPNAEWIIHTFTWNSIDGQFGRGVQHSRCIEDHCAYVDDSAPDGIAFVGVVGMDRICASCGTKNGEVTVHDSGSFSNLTPITNDDSETIMRRVLADYF